MAGGFRKLVFSPLAFKVFDDGVGPTGPIPEPVTEWTAETLAPLGPVIRNEYKRYKFLDSRGDSYYRRPEDVINGYSGKT